MELTNREHVVLGVRGMFLEALRQESRTGCDAEIQGQPVSLVPPYIPFSATQILDSRPLLPRPSQPAQNSYQHHFSVSFRPRYVKNKEFFKSVFVHLMSLRQPLCYEVFGNRQHIELQFSISRQDVSLAMTTFSSLSDIVLEPCEDMLPDLPYKFIDFVPLPPYFRSFTTLSEIPLISGFVKATLSHIHYSVIQVIFQPLDNRWRENFIHCLELEKRLSAIEVNPAFEYTALTKQQYKFASQKAAQPLFAVAVRIASTDRRELQNLASLFNGCWYGDQPLKQISGDLYPCPHIIPSRQTYRHGMLLSADELGILIDLPSPDIVKDCGLYSSVTVDNRDDLVLGYSNCRPVHQQQTARTRHTVIVGKTGKGKSTLLLNMIAQDIEHGQGIAVIDPHGELIREVTTFIPHARLDDVVYLSPVESMPLGFNLFHAAAMTDRGKMADDLVYCFQNAFSSWGERMEAIFRQCFYALFTLENACLADLRTLLSAENSTLRDRLIPLLNNQEAVQFWTEDFRHYHRSAFDPILNKMSKFLLNEQLGRLFRQRTNLIDLQWVINSGKILLINLPTGTIGTKGVDLLGGIFITALYHACLSRAVLPPSQRRPFFLYVDEFQRFTTKSTEDILREARKYNLGMVVAFQQFGNLREEISTALNNADTLVAFDLGLEDSKLLLRQFHGLELQDLQQKGVGEVWALLNDQLCRFQTVVRERAGCNLQQEILLRSLARYYTQVSEGSVQAPLDGVPYDEI